MSQASLPVIDLVAGARPNFMKLAPVVHAIKMKNELAFRIVHTGQHYDPLMNDVFFAQLGIPRPDVHLEVGSGTHGEQTARIIEGYEKHLMKVPPSATVVFGDVNSTVACALAAVKLHIPVVHVEAGLRSFDRKMPEEVNRVLTDSISELLLVSEPSGLENLKAEGISNDKIVFVGNVMIDTLIRELAESEQLKSYERFGLKKKQYALLTMHRPSNVDDPAILKELLELIVETSRTIPIVLPVHPRTKAAAQRAGLSHLFTASPSFLVVEPLPYRENLSLMEGAKFVLTDSGGMQEETALLHVPCLTMRSNTERPVTVKVGTSRLVGNDVARIRQGVVEIMEGNWPRGGEIPLWDGRASERVASSIFKWLMNRSDC